jgi:acyl-CoA carboxylase subunit beta
MKQTGRIPLKGLRSWGGRLVAKAPLATRGWPRRTRCPSCGAPGDARRACARCGRARRLSAAEWISVLADRNSFRPLGAPLVADPLQFVDEIPYVVQLARAREATGVDEAIVIGRASVEGLKIVLIVFDFRFLGGSLGIAAGERIVTALEVARDERSPAVMLVASSGARMQEGFAALLQMARTSAAVAALREAGVPLITVLTDPSTGGPFASCASQADFVLAEQGALLGLAGPRVVAALTGGESEGRTAEELAERGIVDCVVTRDGVRTELARLLGVLARPRAPLRPKPVALPPPSAPGDRWQVVERLRRSDWPTGTAWLDFLGRVEFELVGDRTGSDDAAVRCALIEIEGAAAVVLAQDRLAGPIGPGGYRKVLRVLPIAARLGLPVLSLIDTEGSAIGSEADGQGIAYWVAQCFGEMMTVPVPVVAVVVGQGSSGGALALGVGDRLYMLETSIFTVISPEGAAAIISRDPSRAPDWANRLKLSAADALSLGLIDGVLPGWGEGRHARSSAIRRVRSLIGFALADLAKLDPADLVSLRRNRYLQSTRHLLHSPEQPSVHLPSELPSAAAGRSR